MCRVDTLTIFRTKESIAMQLDNNFAGSPIKKDETRAAIRKMKSGKTICPYSILVELLESLEDIT